MDIIELVDLVRRAQNGDEAAFGQIYDDFAPRIFRYVKLKIQHPPDAEDVLQEVFIKAYKGLGSLDMDKLNFSAWLYKVASNTINDHFRKKYRTPEVSVIDEKFDAPSDYSLEKDLMTKWDWDAAKAAFLQLPPLYRQVLELRFEQQFTIDEVAEIIGKSNLSIRLIQHRALKKIRFILKDYDLQPRKI
ncbi:MAG: sigma-70 family RNA polymerase sigma factor [Patescibacteria group bacterium]|nr:sigma-70 family RNA polymerase sigma factor [Patescibacteria group bacterium]